MSCERVFHRAIQPVSLAALGALALACAPMRAPDPSEFRQTLTSSSIAMTEGPDWAASLGPESPEENPQSSESLSGFLTEVQSANPALQASWMDFEAALQRVPQVTALSEPMLTATIPIEEVQTRTGPQDFALGIQQRFPWFGVLDLRGQVALLQAQEALQTHAQALLDTTRRAQGLWWELAFQQSARANAEEEIALLDSHAEIAASRYATGMGTQQAILRAELEISHVQERIISIDERIASLTVDLNTLANRPAEAPLAVPPLSEVALGVIEADTAALIASAEAQRPELAGLRSRLARHTRERELARLRYFPEMMIGANWIAVGNRPDHVDVPGEGQDVSNIVVGATIPLWWRSYRAAVNEAERRIEATNMRIQATENSVAQDVLTAGYAMTEALDLMELYATTLIPQAEQTLEATESAFATGQTSMLDLIDAERVLLRLRLAHERARRDHLLAVADLERAIGAALVEVER